jgi:DeoR/GlpR family transcriptional regulator of sugar metabolism
MISNAPHRYQQILQFLKEEDTLPTKELPSRLGVTPMTVWRDLQALEEQGLLRRSRGRIQRLERGVIEPDFQSKHDLASDAKQRIAAYAVKKFVGEGDYLAIDGGTTVAAMARQPLPAGLSIFTNSLHTASLFLVHEARPMVYVCGGLLRERSGTFIGREAMSFFGKRRITRYFLSATGVDAEEGVTDLTLEDNEVKRAMASASNEVVLMADRSKLGVKSHMQVLPWRRIHHFVTDAPAARVKPIRSLNGPNPHIHRIHIT